MPSWALTEVVFVGRQCASQLALSLLPAAVDKNETLRDWKDELEGWIVAIRALRTGIRSDSIAIRLLWRLCWARPGALE